MNVTYSPVETTSHTLGLWGFSDMLNKVFMFGGWIKSHHSPYWFTVYNNHIMFCFQSVGEENTKECRLQTRLWVTVGLYNRLSCILKMNNVSLVLTLSSICSTVWLLSGHLPLPVGVVNLCRSKIISALDQSFWCHLLMRDETEQGASYLTKRSLSPPPLSTGWKPVSDLFLMSDKRNSGGRSHGQTELHRTSVQYVWQTEP